MTHEEIEWKILEVFQKCNVRSFPINLFDIIEQHGYECIEYTEQSEVKQEACQQISDDAFRLNNKVYYNDQAMFCRRRFSLAHEIGHIVLGHRTPYTNVKEREANYFASRLLAPRIAIYYAECKNANDVSKIFQMTYEASSYAFDDYRRWRRYAIYHKKHSLDKLMYKQFYNDTQKCFVWSIRKCLGCKTELFNQLEDKCDYCKMYTHRPDYLYEENKRLVTNARGRISQAAEYIPGFNDAADLRERNESRE